MEAWPLGISTSLYILLAASATAQHPAGLMTGMPPAGIIRSSLDTGVGSELIARIPADSYQGIGTYVAPAAHRIRGARLHLLDSTLGDGERFDLHVYFEAGQTNLPTIQGPNPPGTTAVLSVLDQRTPQGIAEHEIEVLFPTPVDVPIGSDLFLGITWITPGLRMRTVGGTAVQGIVTSLFDNCGPGLPASESYAFTHSIGVIGPLGSGTVGWQPMIELLVDGASGVAVAVRAPGTPPTASMYSGLHPDSATPSHQPSRHDVPGYVFLANGAVAEGSPVFLLGSLQPFAWQPWIVISPGNAILHLSPINLTGLGLGFVGNDGKATILWPVPASPAVRGVTVRSQAFAFDSSTGYVAAGAAVRQRF